jgi:DNA-binding response OmpR family regulator
MEGVKNMAESGNEKLTILTIDDDPDIRATLRIVLEAEGFAVGEASTGEEGVKIAQRIKPDAIIMDLMMENVDSGTVASNKLKEAGYEGPIYLLSSAGDTVRYNLDARDLGLAGIFQKPIDPKGLVATIKAKLKS